MLFSNVQGKKPTTRISDPTKLSPKSKAHIILNLQGPGDYHGNLT